jgi:hypothetical protein
MAERKECRHCQGRAVCTQYRTSSCENCLKNAGLNPNKAALAICANCQGLGSLCTKCANGRCMCSEN